MTNGLIHGRPFRHLVIRISSFHSAFGFRHSSFEKRLGTESVENVRLWAAGFSPISPQSTTLAPPSATTTTAATAATMAFEAAGALAGSAQRLEFANGPDG